MLESLALIEELVGLPGPPGHEGAVRTAVAARASALGYSTSVDAKGNLRIPLTASQPQKPRIVVTAHLDEIALVTTRIETDGRIRVAPLGGAYPWKWGEGPVELMAGGEFIPGVLSFGSIHTNSPAAVAQQARERPLTWEMAFVFTGLAADDVHAVGIRPGTRVVISRGRRVVQRFGDHVGSYFLDDRADLAAMLLALESIAEDSAAWRNDVLFAATVYEETGGEGARYLLGEMRPDLCIALEIGPSVPESPFFPDDRPTIWAMDGYSIMADSDGELLAAVVNRIGLSPHWQALSRGGSDASCSAAVGLCARHMTLGLPVENSHGFEVMHVAAPRQLSNLLVELLRSLP